MTTRLNFYDSFPVCPFQRRWDIVFRRTGARVFSRLRKDYCSAAGQPIANQGRATGMAVPLVGVGWWMATGRAYYLFPGLDFGSVRLDILHGL